MPEKTSRQMIGDVVKLCLLVTALCAAFVAGHAFGIRDGYSFVVAIAGALTGVVIIVAILFCAVASESVMVFDRQKEDHAVREI